CSRVAQYRLANVQAALSRDPKQPADQRAAWRTKALQTVRDLAASGPLPAEPARNLVVLANNLGDHPLALSLIESLRRERPDDPWVYRNRAVIEGNLHAHERALVSLAELRRLAPDHPEGAQLLKSAEGSAQRFWPLLLAKA